MDNSEFGGQVHSLKCQESKIDISSKVKAGTFWLGIRFFISGMIGAITMTLIARILSVEEYGIYNILFAFITWISLFSGFGIPNVFQRFIPEALQQKKYDLILSLVKKGLLLRILLTVLAVLAVSLFSGPIGGALKIDGWEHYFFLFSFGIICVLEARLLQNVLIGLLMHKYVVIANICWSVCRISLLGLVVLLNKGLWGVLWVETISWMVWFCLLGLYYHKNFARLYKKKKKPFFPYKRFFRYGAASFLSETGVSVLDRATDLLVITAFLGPGAAGIYGFCDRLLKLIKRTLPHSVLRDIIRPVFFFRYAESQDPKELEKMFNFLAKSAAFFSFPVAAGICSIGREFIFYIFGEKFLPAYVPLSIIVLFGVFGVLSVPSIYILKSLEKVNILFFSKIFAVYNLLGDLLVVKPFGVAGVALVTSSAQLFQNLFCLFFAKRYTGVQMRFAGLLKIAVNAVFMGMALLMTRPYINGILSLSISILLGCLCYLGMSFLNKAFTKRERQIINKHLPVPFFLF